jgi:predicted O-methyltransferase YrrM
VSPLPESLRRLAPLRLRDEPRVRAIAVGLGLIPPRAMHSEDDARVLRAAAAGARRAVEIGVYEGSSAIVLCDALAADAELHLIDPFGHHPDALPRGWGATEWATRRVIARARGPRVRWHVALSCEVAATWRDPVDLVFIDGDHSEHGCARDWEDWHRFVAPWGRVVFHDARSDQTDGRGLPGPTAVLARLRAAMPVGWRIAEEADRTVALRRDA